MSRPLSLIAHLTEEMSATKQMHVYFLPRTDQTALENAPLSQALASRTHAKDTCQCRMILILTPGLDSGNAQ